MAPHEIEGLPPPVVAVVAPPSPPPPPPSSTKCLGEVRCQRTVNSSYDDTEVGVEEEEMKGRGGGGRGEGPGGGVEGKEPVPCLWPTRLVAYSGTIFVNLMMACLGPFFAQHLDRNYNFPPHITGVIFGIFPLVALVVSPVASAMCRRIGRHATHFCGLFVGAVSAVSFGFSNSTASFLITRGLQGVSFALVNVSSLAMLIEVAPDLTQEISQQESFIGLSLAICPAISGVVYTYLGFYPLFVMLSIGFCMLMNTMIVLNYTGWLTLLSPRNPPPLQVKAADCRHALEGGDNHSSAVGMRLPMGVILAALTVGTTQNLISYLELTFSNHLYTSLGLSPMGTGLMFSVTDGAYTLTGLLMARTDLLKALHSRTLLALGLILEALAFLCMGFPPLSSSLPSSAPLPMVWFLNITACILMGPGQAFAIMPALDLMKTSLKQQHPTVLPLSPSKPSSSSSSSSPVDRLPAIMNCAVVTGQFVGPLLGSLCLEYLYKTPDMRCTTQDYCHTGFRWSCFIYALACLALSTLLLLLLRPKQDSRDLLR